MVYKLRLLKLYCYLPDESDGDEIYIILNGQRIWPKEEKYKTIVDKETALDFAMEINKGDSLELELWDYDVLSRNDLLGKLTLVASAHGKYLVDFVKTGPDKSKYGLEYELG
jgi:hypothetical protein